MTKRFRRLDKIMFRRHFERIARPSVKATQSRRLTAGFVTAAGLILASGMFASATWAQSADETSEFQDLPITVQSGDTFSAILARELNSLDAWGDVARYNKLQSPDTLSPGDVIVIPAEVLRLRNYATVVYVKGSALLHERATDSKSDAEKGDRIYLGDVIETDDDGFVSVSFNGGSSVNIQPDSNMEITILECVDRDEACEIGLQSAKGQLGLDVQSVGFEKPTVFNIDSPYASAAVRGTRFDFDVNNGNVLGVTEGTVEISYNGLSNSINIGKGVLAGEGKSINDVFDLLQPPEPVLLEAVSRISKEDIINWQAVEDAASYLIAYAPSESMQDALISRSEAGTFTKPELQPGELFVSIRAIATNGLRGFTFKKKIVSVALDADAESPLLDIGLNEDEMQITVPGSASDEFELKIGNTLETIDTDEYVVANQIHSIRGGETLTLEVDRARQWYVQGRKVVNTTTVSPYGLLYFVEGNGG